MADSAATPRRSQRDRKQVKPFASSSQSPSKPRTTNEDDLTDLDDADDHHDADAEPEDDHQDFPTPKSKKRAAPHRKSKGPPPAKKPRTAKSTTAPSKPSKPKQRRTKAKAANGHFDPTQLASDTKIAPDNAIFNTLLNPSAALQSTAEDFLHSLSQNAGTAQAELINCILRACGCNDSVDADQVIDYDGVVDSLDNFTEGLKQENSPIYPLTSKLPAFKRFRTSLSELIERLVLAAADLGSLYSTDLITTLQTWVIAMSSSQIRSFRHTATVVALEIETALCQVAAAVEKEAEILGRQREGERKRKAIHKSTAVREKDLDGKAAGVRKRRTILAEYLKEIVDGVFVHRYRDLDPNIRSECVKAMGSWFTHYPAHFLDGSYLRYVGWVLSDSSTPVRLEAVRALAIVYAQSEYVGSITHFTQRFKPRLLEMAGGDTELSVRTADIGVLSAIDSNALLEDEERERICLLLFDAEARVRKAASPFVAGVWQEVADERVSAIAGRNKGQRTKSRAGVKALAMLLVKWGKALDRASEAAEEDSETDEGDSGPSRRTHLPLSCGVDPRGRIPLAVEALWDEVDAVNDWECILDVLLLDHSAGRDEDMDGPESLAESARNTVDPAWRLSEVEETVLLEVLVASLRRARLASTAAKKGDEETVISDLTRALIKGLPRLFIKYQTDENRISEVLLIPPLMNLDLYLEMRMMNAYAGLWDDVSKQFLSHSSQSVLTKSVAAIRHFMAATSLTNTNSTKILELEDELATQLRDAVAGREEIEVATFSEDEVIALGAVCARICALAGSRDTCAWMEEDEGGKQSSVWDIISALVERGRLGYKEEERMVEQGLHLLGLHIIWKARSLPDVKDTSPDSDNFRQGYSNTAEVVKLAAFQNLMNLHILFYPSQATSPRGDALPTEPLSLQLEEDVQQRYEESESEHGDSSEEEEHAPTPKDGKSKGKSSTKTSAKPSTKPVSTFLRAIRAGVVHVKHSDVLLANHGRLGPSFDLYTKVIIDVLREEGMYNDNGDLVVEVVKKALLESFSLVMDSVVKDEERMVGLAKQLATSFLVRGAQLAVVRRLDSRTCPAYEKSKNKKRLGLSVSFFRALIPLLKGVESRDALGIKAYLDQLVSDAKIEVKPTAKTWEPLRAYEKKLVSIMHKGTGKGRKAKGGAVGTSDEESGPEAEGRGEGGVEQGDEVEPARETRARPGLRPRPKAVVRRPPTPSGDDGQQQSDVEMDGAEDGDEVAQETPKSRTAGTGGRC
ncbi:hypothetical protein JVT61DRAFT_8438 [Boletus reticuloceps]|uniref:SCD domain-containing protein n=1 Tax=Boletus reticuloceps TaxID=495285 RepID=A0A8I3AEF9_9AGAM|nr:hypothetical protein JVT61DRAFT_8438 [Boletus reticuloceps]